MQPPKFRYDLTPEAPNAVLREDGIESGFIGRLQGLKVQVHAVQPMVKCVDDDNGFIWHATGSGKTLTSFNAPTLATLRDTLLPKLLSGGVSMALAEKIVHHPEGQTS